LLLLLLLLLQSVDAEVQDLYREFQSEKEDLLDSIRLLGQQMLLKDAVISAFIPQVCSSALQQCDVVYCGIGATSCMWSAVLRTCLEHGTKQQLTTDMRHG
jgi:hypothetical protein